MIRPEKSRLFYPALLASVTYMVFLAASAPHRVHHLFDSAGPGSKTIGGAEAPQDPARMHRSQEPAPGPPHHSEHHTSHETDSENPCALLAAFQQHPGSLAEPAVHAGIQPAPEVSVPPVYSPSFAAREDPFQSRAPPRSVERPIFI